MRNRNRTVLPPAGQKPAPKAPPAIPVEASAQRLWAAMFDMPLLTRLVACEQGRNRLRSRHERRNRSFHLAINLDLRIRASWLPVAPPSPQWKDRLPQPE